MTDYFDFDPQAGEAVKGAMSTGDYIQLPFDAVLFRWVRGEANIQSDMGSGARHFGGWAASEDDLTGKAKDIPEKFQLEYFTTPDGSKTYGCYTVRSLAIATMGRRFRWFTDPRNQGDKGRGHLQILGMCAMSKVENKVITFTPWMPVILSAKGLTTKHMEDALKTWEHDTAIMRQTHANGIPAHFFYGYYGTFGKERKPLTVGRSGAQNYITPPTVFIPENLDVEYLRRAYVGRQMADQMAEMVGNSQEWLHAWDKENQPEQTSTAPKKPAQPSAADIPF
jgi:hypothetical protein